MRQQRGVGLIEVILFMLIVSVGIAGMLMIFGTLTQRSADVVAHKQALLIAEGVLDEVLVRKYFHICCVYPVMRLCNSLKARDIFQFLSVTVIPFAEFTFS